MTQELFKPDMNFGGLPHKYAREDAAHVIIIPVPYDSTVEWRTGSRYGPQSIIEASQYLELYDHELDQEPYRVGIHTLPSLQPAMSGPAQMIQRVQKVASHLMEKRKLLVMLGGEHSLTVGMVKAFKEHYSKLSVLQFDAHADLRDEYLGTKYSHACSMRRVLESCPIVQVGVRSLSIEEHTFLRKSGMQPFYKGEREINSNVAKKVASALSYDVYVTIDLDVMDPSIMPAVGTPEPGGMSWFEILRVLSTVAQTKNIVGFDIVELCPSEGPVSCSFLAAKLAYRIIGLCNLK